MICEKCKKKIGMGERYVTIDYNIESLDVIQNVATVEEAESLMIFHVMCAPSKGTIAEALRHLSSQ